MFSSLLVGVIMRTVDLVLTVLGKSHCERVSCKKTDKWISMILLEYKKYFLYKREIRSLYRPFVNSCGE